MGPKEPKTEHEDLEAELEELRKERTEHFSPKVEAEDVYVDDTGTLHY
jgi:hypothetical protein